MFEKRWAAVSPQLFTSNGTANGKLTIADACIFKVKQQVNLSSNTLPNLNLEIKSILDDFTILVGPTSSNIFTYSDISAYLVADGANIWTIEQKRSSVPVEEINRAVYEEEPTVATRVVMVDKCGEKYGPGNPLPIAFDGTVTVGNVTITDDDGDELAINNDGSINVNVLTSPSASPGLNTTYNAISAVTAGVETTLLTITAPANGMKFYKIDVSGENITLFRVKINATTKFTKRTFFGGNLNESFIFEPFENGLELNSGDILTVTVLHSRPSLSNYEATALSINL